MNLSDLLEPDAIAVRVSAASKRQVLAVAAGVAARTMGASRADALAGLLAREAEGSTGVGSGVAVPHARLEGLDRVRGVFLQLETPVAFEALDERPVDLVIALFAPADDRIDHLRALAKVSRLLRRPDLREQLRQARSVDAVRALLTRDAEPSAA